MTLDALTAHVWSALPLKRHLAGRRVVSSIVAEAVRTWPVAVMEQCDEHQTNVVGKFHARAVERAVKREYGMGIILTLVLSALVQEVVKILIRWWLDHRTEMRSLTAEVQRA
jgi:hypothetical protein